MINPYNFVRSDKPMPPDQPNGHDRLQGFSGVITCHLQVVTPIFTPALALRTEGALADLSFFRINGRPALPGSSLKGMLRSLAESICNGCGPFDSRERPVHPPCSSAENLCPTCRLFGYLKGDQVHAGHVGISDATAQDGFEFGPRVTLKELSSPKPQRHGPFYNEAARQRGRKFYYHQQHVRTAADIPKETQPTHRNVRVEPLIRGAFDFAVRYWNVAETELGLLIHTLDLPPNLYHKFGMAKPLGLGTVRISIIGWKEDNPVPSNPRSRYQGFQMQHDQILLQGLEGEALIQAQQRLREQLDQFKRAYARQYSRELGQQPPTDDLWALPAKNLEDLRLMLSLVGYSQEIRYPGYAWFKRHASERLPSAQEVEQDARLPDE
jgi:CRISPR/Cas system CSM-associated protein Csm3 (group 7 of RAMP superfamily)